MMEVDGGSERRRIRPTGEEETFDDEEEGIGSLDQSRRFNESFWSTVE